MSKARINSNRLARHTGLPASSIKKIRNSANANPTLATLIPLAQYFSINISQLIGDESLPHINENLPIKRNEIEPKRIPLLSWQEAINFNEIKTENYTNFSLSHNYSERTYALIVEEDNWEGFLEGSVLIIDPAVQPEHKDFAIIFKKGQTIPALKQILNDEGQLYLKPLVNGYQITPYTAQHNFLGIVMEFKKNLKGTKK